MKHINKYLFTITIIVITISVISCASGPEIIEGELTLYTVTDNFDIVKEKDYKVTADTDSTYQQDIASHREIWELAKKVMPSQYKHYLKSFLIFNGEASSSDGFVSIVNDSVKEWRLSMAINYAYEDGQFNPNDLTQYTLVHEFGHIVALNDQQFNQDISETQCNNYYSGVEGCAKDDSYMQAFYQEFWKGMMTEWDSGNNQDFYSNNQDKFVTEYASSELIEDFAESYAYYVMKGFPATDTLIKDKKLYFFSRYPKFVKLRNEIRANLNLAVTE